MEMIVDGHVHIWQRKMLPSSLLRAYLEPLLALDGLAMDLTIDREQDWPMSQVNSEQLLQSMPEAKVDKAVVLPLDFGLVDAPEVGIEQYNDWVFECCRDVDDKLVPFIGVDPMRGKVAEELVRKYVKHCDAKGVKVYPGTGYFPNDDKVSYFWKLMEDCDLTVVTHGGASWGPLDDKYTHPILFKEVLAKYPEMRLIIAHFGGKFRSETYELAEEFPNVYTDCSALQGWLPSDPETCRSRMQEALRNMPGRVIFGSDWPLFDMSYPYAYWVRFVTEEDWGTEDAKQQMLGGTMSRILSI